MSEPTESQPLRSRSVTNKTWIHCWIMPIYPDSEVSKPNKLSEESRHWVSYVGTKMSYDRWGNIWQIEGVDRRFLRAESVTNKANFFWCSVLHSVVEHFQSLFVEHHFQSFVRGNSRYSARKNRSMQASRGSSRIDRLVPVSTGCIQYQPVFSPITPLIRVKRGGWQEKRGDNDRTLKPWPRKPEKELRLFAPLPGWNHRDVHRRDALS
jgi:hypothetical protein